MKRNLLLRRLIGVLAVSAPLVLMTGPAQAAVPAFSIGTCPAAGYHVWGHQYASGNYYGQFGWFTTYNMSVPHYTSAFSLSHLYAYAGSANPASAGTEIEVGYYKGLGNQSYNSPHYYW